MSVDSYTDIKEATFYDNLGLIPDQSQETVKEINIIEETISTVQVRDFFDHISDKDIATQVKKCFQLKLLLEAKLEPPRRSRREGKQRKDGISSDTIQRNEETLKENEANKKKNPKHLKNSMTLPGHMVSTLQNLSSLPRKLKT